MLFIISEISYLIEIFNEKLGVEYLRDNKLELLLWFYKNFDTNRIFNSMAKNITIIVFGLVLFVYIMHLLRIFAVYFN